MDGYNKSSHFHKSCPFSKSMYIVDVGSISNQTTANCAACPKPAQDMDYCPILCFKVACNVPGITSELTARTFGVLVVVLWKRVIYLHVVYTTTIYKLKKG